MTPFLFRRYNGCGNDFCLIQYRILRDPFSFGTYMKKICRISWRVWCKALGEKASSLDKEADTVAIIRTFIFLTYLITNIAIVANAVRHWNDVDYSQRTEYTRND